MITYSQNRLCPCARCRMNYMLLPAVLITCGVLLLLGNLGVASLHRTFPIVLIVIGAIKVLQSSASTEGHRDPSLQAQPSPAAPAANPLAQDPNANASSTSSSEGR